VTLGLSQWTWAVSPLGYYHLHSPSLQLQNSFYHPPRVEGPSRPVNWEQDSAKSCHCQIPELKDCRLCEHSGLDFVDRSGLQIRELLELELTGQMGNSAGRYEMARALGAGGTVGGGQYMMLTPLTGLARRSSLELDSVVYCEASNIDIIVEGLFVSPLALSSSYIVVLNLCYVFILKHGPKFTYIVLRRNSSYFAFFSPNLIALLCRPIMLQWLKIDL